MIPIEIFKIREERSYFNGWAIERKNTSKKYKL